jgi:hypothetical protein
MSTVKSKKLQVGTDATSTNNFTIYQPSTPDGTLRIGQGDADSPTEVARITSTGISSSGNIIQVAQSTKTNTFSTTSQTFVDITDLEVAITPSSTSSKIMLFYNVSCGTVTGHAMLKAVRTIGGTSSDVLVGDADGSNRIRANHKIYNSSTYATTYTTSSMVGQILDTPNTTSPVIYKIQGAISPYSTAYTLVVNRTGNTSNLSWDARTCSQITVMEVAA